MSRGRATIGTALAAYAGLMLSGTAGAADIDHTSLGEGAELITIIGDLKAGDEEKFRRLSIQYDKAVVALASDGGMLLPAIEIGKMIRIKEYSTVVLDDFECTSSCALIWVAGSKRLLAPKGRIGFHASYTDVGGKKVETGLGNALVGRYLTLLNLPEKAVLFATAAPPDRVLWLTAETMDDAGIEFKPFGEREVSPPPIVRTNVAPPPVISTPVASGVVGTRGWVHVSSGDKTKYYLDRARMYRVGRYIAAWELADESENPDVAYYQSKELRYYDCASRRTALKKSVDYDSKGKAMKSYDWSDIELRWHPVVPDSVGETKFNYACRSGI